MNPRPFLIATLAAAAALSVTQRAAATPGYYQLVSAAGSYFTDAGVVTNTNTGSAFATSDGSVYRYVTCVASKPGGTPCDTFDPSPPVFWYDWPNEARNAAAQARTTDYGVMQARAWSSGFQPGSTNIPGYRLYGAAANSGFIDEITTSAAAPVVITFVFSLHGSWNDAGTFLFQAGRPGFYDPDVGGATPMEGHTWSNCDNCQFAYDTGSARTLLPGGANGSTDITVLVPFTVNPASLGNPVDPSQYTNPFEAQLSAFASYNDTEVDAYSTVTLQSILVPPNAGLSFASGHAYSITVVPEPATYALWLMGLVGVAAAKRHRGQQARAVSGEDFGR